MNETKRLKKRLISILSIAIKDHKRDWQWEQEQINPNKDYKEKAKYRIRYYKKFSNYTLILANGVFKVADKSSSRESKIISKFLLWGFIPTNKIFFYYLYLQFIRFNNNVETNNKEKTEKEKRIENEYKNIVGSLEDDLKQEVRKEKLEKLK